MVAIDVTAGTHGFTTDCEVCCRPFEVMVRAWGDGDAEVTVHV